VNSFKRKAGLLAAVALTVSAAATPLSAHEQSFGALEGIEAQPLSAAQMDAVHGQAYTLAVLALLSYAAQVQTTTTQTPTTTQTQTATQYTAIATSLSSVRVVTQTYYVRTSTGLVLVRR
jgi:hypothetical protein